jgi:hypothetical protein
VNNRELATVVWAGVLLVAILSNRDLRRSLWSVVVALRQPKLIVPLILMVGYVYGVLQACAATGVWRAALVPDTVAWAIGSGITLFAWSIRVFKPGGSFGRVVRASISSTLLVEAFVNLYVFPLPVEFVLLPIGVFIAGMSAVADSDRQFAGAKYEPVKRLLAGLTMTLGVVLITWVLLNLATGWRHFDITLNAEKVALPIWLTVVVLPYVALLGAFSNYDTTFAMIRWASDDRRRRARARVALICELRLRVRDVGAFSGMWCKELTAAHSLDEARTVVRRFRSQTAMS